MTEVAIVGAWETPEPGVIDGVSLLELHATPLANVLLQCGLGRGDIDGIACGTESPIGLAGHLGIQATWLDSTYVGNCSSLLHVRHAVSAIKSGDAQTVAVVHGETLHSLVGVQWPWPPVDPSSMIGQFEQPFGAGPHGAFAMGLLRYMREHGISEEQLAAVPVAQRRWAHPNPMARYRELVSVDDVLASPIVAHPLHRLHCAATTDSGGALIVTSLERARDLTDRPIVVVGGGEAYESPLVSQLSDVATPRSLARSAVAACRSAGVAPSDLDHAMLFDGFAHGVLLALEAMGICAPGDAAGFVAEGNTSPGGALPVNTNGGFLSCRHGEMQQIQEAVRQLRGDALTQVPDVAISLVQGASPTFSGAVTIILSADEQPNERSRP